MLINILHNTGFLNDAMKKMLSMLLVCMMVFTLVACGGKKDENKYNLDMESTEVQEMSSDRASEETLAETYKEYFGGYNYFAGTEQAEYTYDDVVEHIGTDPSEYRYDEDRDAGCYTWYAEEGDTASLQVWFQNDKLYAAGAYNLPVF